MKIACSADIHSHNFREFSVIRGETGSSRLEDILKGLDYMFQYCLDNDIYHWIFAGDLFHTRGRVDTVVLNATTDRLKGWADKGIKMYLLVGNHDQANKKESPDHSLHILKDYDNMFVIDAPMYRVIGEEVTVLFIPYSNDGEKVKDIISDMNLSNTKPLLVSHLGLSGAFVGADSYAMQDYFKIQDLLPDQFQYGILGHYHKWQFIEGAPHFFYCGSPLQHNFNDEGQDRGFMVIDTEKRWNIQFIPIPGPKFITINDYTKYNLSELVGSYVRFMVPEDKIQHLKTCIPEGLQYKIIPQKTYKEVSRVNVKIGMSFEEIISNYAQEFNPQAKEVGLEILREVQGR